MVVIMTNEKRIFELCRCIVDLIDELASYDDFLKNSLDWIRCAASEIREEIYEAEKEKGVNIYYD